MAYLPELHRCCVCGDDLGPDNGDGICAGCDAADPLYPQVDLDGACVFGEG